MRLAFGADTAAWFARDPARLARRLVRSGRTAPALYLDVGRDDPFLDQGRAFHAELLALGVAHRYAERPGKHDWSYWRSHVGESLAWLMSVIGD
jgi:S-formylglutathione hydrolase FrmB